MLYPEYGAVDCAECRKWVLDDNLKPVIWNGAKIPRPRRAPPPCEANPPRPCAFRRLGLEAFWPENEKTFRRYQMGRLMGFADSDKLDEDFREVACIISDVIESCRLMQLHWAIWGKKE